MNGTRSKPAHPYAGITQFRCEGNPLLRNSQAELTASPCAQAQPIAAATALSKEAFVTEGGTTCSPGSRRCLSVPRTASGTVPYTVLMLRLREAITFRLREKASVFLAELHPAADATARAAILHRLRKRDHDATHHCSAWREGAPIAAWGSDDDGEPGGTAGRPMLAVLEGRDLTDVLAVCIRWFGGTKLGTGGLVRAYTEAVQGALAAAEAAGLLDEVRILKEGSITVAPDLAHLPYAVLGAFPEAEIEGQDFALEGARLRFRLPPDRCEALEKLWKERSRGGSVQWAE